MSRPTVNWIPATPEAIEKGFPRPVYKYPVVEIVVEVRYRRSGKPECDGKLLLGWNDQNVLQYCFFARDWHYGDEFNYLARRENPEPEEP